MSYADEYQNDVTLFDLDKEITPEAGEKKVSASTMLPNKSQMVKKEYCIIYTMTKG